MFKRTIICLAASSKHSALCIAGKDIDTGEWVRPVSEHGHKEITSDDLCFENGGMPDVLDIVTIPFITVKPNEYQPENILVDKGSFSTLEDKYNRSQLDKLCDTPNEIFANEGSETGKMSPEAFLSSGLKSSLLFVKVGKLAIERYDKTYATYPTKRKLQAVFPYNGRSYHIDITDPRIRDKYLLKKSGQYPINSKSIYLCISTGEPFVEYDNMCYKWVASIIHF